MYVFFSILLTLVFIFLTVAGETGRGKNCPHVFFWTNFGFSAAGILLAAVTFLCARSGVFGSGFDAEFVEWAWDMLKVYYQLSLIPCAVFLVISALSCFIAVLEGTRKRTRHGTGLSAKLRLCLAVTVVFSVVMLFLAPMYAFMTVNESVALDRFVFLTGFAEALIMRAPLLIVYGVQMRAKKNVTET